MEFTCSNCGVYNKVAGYYETVNTGANGKSVPWQVQCWKCCSAWTVAAPPDPVGPAEKATIPVP